LARLLTEALPPAAGCVSERLAGDAVTVFPHGRSVVFTALIAAGLAGCQPEEQIAQYTIPKAESIQLPAATPGKGPGSESTAGRPERMLAAILPGGEQSWFFKLTGPVDPVAERWDEFREFVKSVHFGADGNPDWTLPAGWTKQPGNQMRFATLVIAADPPLEISVSALATSEDTVLANINRWRGQLSLPPVTADNLGDESEMIATKSGALATVINLVGTSKGGGMMSGPFARGGMPSSPPLQPSAAPPSVTYDTPEGWTPGKVGGMRKAALEVMEGDYRAEITVIDLPRDPQASERLANVNRWRGQVALSPVTADELKSAMRPLPVGSLTGDYVELIGTEGGDAAQSILGVIVDRDDKTWFVKLQGPTPVALSQRANFEQFVKSLKFE